MLNLCKVFSWYLEFQLIKVAWCTRKVQNKTWFYRNSKFQICIKTILIRNSSKNCVKCFFVIFDKLFCLFILTTQANIGKYFKKIYSQFQPITPTKLACFITYHPTPLPYLYLIKGVFSSTQIRPIQSLSLFTRAMMLLTFKLNLMKCPTVNMVATNQ